MSTWWWRSATLWRLDRTSCLCAVATCFLSSGGIQVAGGSVSTRLERVVQAGCLPIMFAPLKRAKGTRAAVRERVKHPTCHMKCRGSLRGAECRVGTGQVRARI